MRIHYRRLIAATVASIAAVTTIGTSTALAASNGGASTAASPSAPSTVAGADHTKLLLNGDRLTAAGSNAYGVIHSGSGAAATVIIQRGAQTYDVPDAALPYLGRGLDPSLFEVSKLPATGTLPVTVSFQGSKAPALPGVTITSNAAGTASGYLTANSAKTFYAALTRQLAADHKAGSYGAGGIFGTGASIRLAGAPAATAPVTPAFAMHTLTVKGTALNGSPGTGDLITVMNLDNFAFFDYVASTNVLYQGSTKFSVPTGHYLVFGFYYDFDVNGSMTAVRIVTNPDVTVKTNTTVKSDERTATSQVTMSVPQPADTQEVNWTLYMADSLRQASSFEFTSPNGFPTYVNTTKKTPAVGSYRAMASGVLSSPATATAPYTYNLSFLGPQDAIGNQAYTATTSTLATVTGRYFSDTPQIGSSARFPAYQAAPLGAYFETAYRFATPVQRTEYVSADASAPQWQESFWADRNDLLGGQQDVGRLYTPGQQATANWNAFPLHTALNSSALGGGAAVTTMLSAARTGDKLGFYILPFGDNTPGHTGAGFDKGLTSGGGITGTYELDQNGTKIAGGDAAVYSMFLRQVPVSPDPSVYTLTLNAGRTVSPFKLSTTTSTVWTWKSAHVSSATLPAGWTCPDVNTVTRDCASQPLMTLDYHVAGLGLDGTAPAGSQVVGIDVAHQQQATDSPVTGVSASFSTDAGATWQPASVKGSGTAWAASYSAPAGSTVSLKVTATDSNGGAITETVLKGYAVSASAATAGYQPAACAAAKPNQATCFLQYSPQSPAARAAAAAIPAALAGPAGWGATSIQQAYKIPVGRAGGLVAVVDAYDTPNLETYLNAYRAQYGLPPCTTANGCFRKVNQDGQTSSLPPDGTSSGWDLETTLDVDMVSAACPKCDILVVEANSAAISDLGTGVNSAVRLGAAAVSNSYGARESGFTQTFAADFNHPGHAIVASSGDSGYTAAQFPANLKTVTAVGGTELSTASNARGFSEAVWNTAGGAGGSGCSAYVVKPAWQHDAHCPGRTVADVSAVASDIAIYNTTYAPGGWIQVAGTSASAPLIAGIYALAGNTATIKPGYEYKHLNAFYDVTKGDNEWLTKTGGNACGNDYLCVAGRGYDAPTGLGTPNGIGGF